MKTVFTIIRTTKPENVYEDFNPETYDWEEHSKRQKEWIENINQKFKQAFESGENVNTIDVINEIYSNTGVQIKYDDDYGCQKKNDKAGISYYLSKGEEK